MASYSRRVWERAWRETSRFWNLSRWWVAVAPMLTAYAWRMYQTCSLLPNDMTTLLVSLGGLAVAFLGSLPVNLFRAPRLLADDDAKTIEDLQRRVADNALSPIQTAQLKILKDAVGECDCPNELIEVLKYLATYGEQNRIHLPRMMKDLTPAGVERAIERTLACGIVEHVEGSPRPNIRLKPSFAGVIDPWLRTLESVHDPTSQQ